MNQTGFGAWEKMYNAEQGRAVSLVLLWREAVAADVARAAVDDEARCELEARHWAGAVFHFSLNLLAQLLGRPSYSIVK
jgi:hypothetical protein